MFTREGAEKWRKVPKIELHCHLEGCIRLKTIQEFTEELQGLSDEELYAKLTITSPAGGLQHIFDTFIWAQKIFSTKEIIERVTFEVCEDAALDGVVILELRYQPSFIQFYHDKLTYDDIHSSILAGIKRAETKYPQLCVGLIGIIGRNLPIDIAKKTTDFMCQNKDTFIGADLANVEIGNDCVPFADFFNQMKSSGLHVTIHQGEEGDPEKIKDAVERLGAERIGHGIQSHTSQGVIDFLKERNIPLEVCPTSNFVVGVVDSLESHPINKLKGAGLRITINTDDPVVFGVYTLSDEYALLEQMHGWTFEDFKQANLHAFEASFLPMEKKSKYWSEEQFILQ